METATAKVNTPKRPLLVANCTAEFKARVENYAETVERRKVAEMIRLTLEDLMSGRLVRANTQQ